MIYCRKIISCIIISDANLDIDVLEIETSPQSTLLQIQHMLASFGYSMPIINLNDKLLTFPKFSFNRFMMLFEERSLDSDLKLQEIGWLLETKKYIINCAEYDGNRTIDMKVCVHADGNVSKKRLFDALEKIAATELVLRVGFSKYTLKACVEGKQNRRKKSAHRHVVRLSKCNAYPQPPSGDIKYHHRENYPSYEQVRHSAHVAPNSTHSTFKVMYIIFT